jgi:hypothetical protein
VILIIEILKYFSKRIKKSILCYIFSIQNHQVQDRKTLSLTHDWSKDDKTKDKIILKIVKINIIN